MRLRLHSLSVLAAAVLAAVTSVSTATAVTYTGTEPIAYADVGTALGTITGTWLVPGLITITAVSAVIWLWHRVTSRFTKRKA